MLRTFYRESHYQFSYAVFINPACMSVSLRHIAFALNFVEFINDDHFSEYFHKRMFSSQCWQPTADLETLYELRQWMVYM
jgi:hypothetical protein